MRNKLLTVFGSVLMMAGVCFPVYASEEDVYEVGEIQSENQQLMNVDENGNVTAVDTDAPEQELANMPMMMTNDLARDISVGAVDFRTQPSAAYNTLYTEDGTNKQGYLNGYSASDGAFLGYN